MLDGSYNPDVLSCLANLSSDEVFTPPSIANQILDMLPDELWSDKNTTFLDPATKSGVFLREIAKRLMVGLEKEIPDLQTRVDHIMTKQVFGIGITELTSLLARRSLYCSKAANGEYSICQEFDDESGNIFFDQVEHEWKNARCIHCGASQKNYSRNGDLEAHAYQFIHGQRPKGIKSMKFDVILGNPPYQLSDGGAGASAIPLYHKFVEQAKKLNPTYITMVIPSRWFAGGRGLDGFRKEMQNDERIRAIVDYPKSRDCFPGVDIAGGVCYFLWDKNYRGACKFTSIVNDVKTTSERYLNQFDMILRDNVGIGIIEKILSKNEPMMSDEVLSVSPFGLRSYERGESSEFKGSLKLISSGGNGFISHQEVKKNLELVKNFKVCIGYLNPDRAGVNNAADGKVNVTTKVRKLEPNEVVTETYIIPFTSPDPEAVSNCIGYIKTKFVRFLIFQTLSSMHIAQKNFSFVPVQDFSKPWTDEELYKKYCLTDHEISRVEGIIRSME